MAAISTRLRPKESPRVPQMYPPISMPEKRWHTEFHLTRNVLDCYLYQWIKWPSTILCPLKSIWDRIGLMVKEMKYKALRRHQPHLPNRKRIKTNNETSHNLWSRGFKGELAILLNGNIRIHLSLTTGRDGRFIIGHIGFRMVKGMIWKHQEKSMTEKCYMGKPRIRKNLI